MYTRSKAPEKVAAKRDKHLPKNAPIPLKTFNMQNLRFLIKNFQKKVKFIGT
jgi:hypothetical protein